MGAEPLQKDEIFAGGYRIIRRLASGGMGAVYLAEQLATGRERALKRMHVSLADNPQLRALFEREVRVGNRIQSEHVVKVLDAGIDRDTGAPWLTMELLEGESLRQEIERAGPPPRARAADILMQICHGLAAAHRAGVVHRDLKPENIMVCPSEREGAALLVKILDFGLARFADTTSSHRAPMGTPEWMAPEQAMTSHIGRAADVFSLALVAFHVLTGKLFWRAPQHDPLAVLQELLYRPMPRPSERAAEAGAPADALPDGFDEWFARAAAREPAERFPDAGAARAPLRDVLDARPSRPSWPADLALSAPPQPPGAAYDAAWYVARPVEEGEALRYLRSPGKPAVLWGPRQSGKTWLLRRLVGDLTATGGFSAAVIQTNLLERSSMDALLRAFGAAILEACGGDLGALEAEWRGFGTPMQKISRVVGRHVLRASATSLIIAMDSVDVLWRSSVGDDFFALLRAWAERNEPPWPKLRLLLAVSTAPGALIEDTHRSPFNLTVPVRLRSLDAAQLAHLAALHGVHLSAGDVERLAAFSGGHPIAARRVLYRAATDRLDIDAASSAEVHDLAAWYREQGLLRAARALDAGARLDAEERARLVRSGVAIEDPTGGVTFATPYHREAARELP